jgi:hypothetical protein
MSQPDPPVLYRYRSFAGRGAAELERTIVHRELYCSAPLKFNDPFDCRPVFELQGTKAEVAAYCERVVRKYMPHLNREQLRSEVRDILADPLRNPLSSQAASSLQSLHTNRVTEAVGVLCLSVVPDNILLWAHYADAHQGVCLIFDATSNFFEPAQEVQYPSLRPRINPLRDSDDSMLTSALLTKSSDWAYEEEWRLIHYLKGPGLYTYPSGALLGVILGAQISLENETLVRQWINEAEGSISLYRGSPSTTEYRVNITPSLP